MDINFDTSSKLLKQNINGEWNLLEYRNVFFICYYNELKHLHNYKPFLNCKQHQANPAF